MKLKTATNDAIENSKAKYSSKSVMIDNTLPNLNSEITYTVTIENKTNDVYWIKNVTTTLSNADIVDDASDYQYQIIGGNQQVDIDITFNYGVETLPNVKTQSGLIAFVFEQPSAALIQYSSEYTNVTNVQDAIDELYELLDS